MSCCSRVAFNFVFVCLPCQGDEDSARDGGYEALNPSYDPSLVRLARPPVACSGWLTACATHVAQYADFSDRTRKSLARLNESVVDYDLIEELLTHIHESRGPGAILVFMPGIREARTA